MLLSWEKREFLSPYLPEYHRVKAVVKQTPRLFAQFQSRLWLIWSKRWVPELRAPDPEDADAVRHWNRCRQRDLLVIIRTLALWEPFYAEGRKKKEAGPAELRSIRIREASAQLSVQAQDNRIQRKIEAWIEVQKIYMPRTTLLRTQDEDRRAVGTTVPPSKIPLYLPSAALRLNAIDLTTQSTVVDDEWWLRIAQANDTLAALREHLLLKSYLTAWRQRFSRGQRYGVTPVACLPM
ncbi:uncharacterized protein ARMOST_22031 [Armillaria ostoyae]|uniref:Uncharacterized protein n=1 Tax=Armillaria ostoyae TaxID=47428 RepID=A0A284SBQ7_ARMOS|nr:uncharacterized protein ARMOST_22031 [Armillaria ostoyae]